MAITNVVLRGQLMNEMGLGDTFLQHLVSFQFLRLLCIFLEQVVMGLRDPAHTVTTFYYGNSVKYPRRKGQPCFRDSRSLIA